MKETENILTQSSSTWRHSTARWSFPKAGRFSMYVKPEAPPYYNINDSSRNKTYSCSLGKGEKQYIPIWELRKSREVPPPNRYDIKWQKSKLFGKFGKGHRFDIHRTADIPGPGTYDVIHLPV